MRTDTSRRLLAPAAAALISLGLAGPAAADGDLDTSFGTAGLTTVHPAPGHESTAYDVVLDGQGRTVMAGGTRSTGQYAFSVARLDAGGDPDAAFGGGDGIVRTTVGAGGTARAVAVDADGRIVVAGDTSSDVESLAKIGLVRYTAAGELDTSFGGGDGIAVTPVGDFGNATGMIALTEAVHVLPGGDILVAGAAGYRHGPGSRQYSYLARFDADGTLDTAFGGGDGITEVLGAPFGSDAQDLVVQADGKIVIGGIGYNSAANHFTLARFTADGALDTSFGTGGIATHNPATMGFTEFAEADLRALDLDAQGRIVAAGVNEANPGLDGEIAVVRFTADGALDETFGDDKAVARARTDGWSEGYDVDALADGTILVAGTAGNDDAFAVARFDADGALMPAFGTGGIATKAVGAWTTVAHGLAVNGAGTRAVLAGIGDQGFTATRWAVTPLGGAEQPLEDPKDEQPTPTGPDTKQPATDAPAPVAAPVVGAPVVAAPPVASRRSAPAPRRCTSRRLFMLDVRRHGLRNGRVVGLGRTTVRAKGRTRFQVDLRARPAGSYRIKLVGTDRKGRRVSIVKRYRTCV